MKSKEWKEKVLYRYQSQYFYIKIVQKLSIKEAQIYLPGYGLVGAGSLTPNALKLRCFFMGLYTNRTIYLSQVDELTPCTDQHLKTFI